MSDKRTKAGTAVLMELLDALEKVRPSLPERLPLQMRWRGRRELGKTELTISLSPVPCSPRHVPQMKSLLADNDAVTNKIAGQAYVENFALKVFAGADDEDRAGKATS